MAARSWLFVKNSRCLWVVRSQRILLRIDGPDATRDERAFATEDELEAFLTALADRFVSEGWILWNVNHDRRRRRSRRRNPRITPDRRAS